MPHATLDQGTRSALLASLDRLVRERIAPEAARIDAAGVFPRDLYQALADLGVLGLWVPPEYGGHGPDPITPLLVSERLARESVALAVTVSNCGDCIGPLLEGGSDAVRRRYLPGMADGSLVPAFCLSEPAGGSDVAAMGSRAERDGGGYVLSGRKAWITSAPVADVFVVFARTDPQAGHRGISAFVVPRDAPGLTVGPAEPLLGLHASPVAEVCLDAVRVPAEARLGAEGDGFRLAMVTLDESRLNIACTALGAAAAAVGHAVAHARERVQFGKPLIEHQGLGFILADLATELASARALLASAVRVLLSGQGRRAGMHAAMAKRVCTDLAMHAAVTAAQVLGAQGLARGSPVERLLRDCKALQIFEGANEIQKWLIARGLARDGLALDELDTLLAALVSEPTN